MNPYPEALVHPRADAPKCECGRNPIRRCRYCLAPICDPITHALRHEDEPCVCAAREYCPHERRTKGG